MPPPSWETRTLPFRLPRPLLRGPRLTVHPPPPSFAKAKSEIERVICGVFGWDGFGTWASEPSQTVAQSLHWTPAMLGVVKSLIIALIF